MKTPPDSAAEWALAAAPESAAVLKRLRAMVDGPEREAFSCITARQEHGVRSVDLAQPCLAILLSGQKQVRSGATRLDFAPGDALAMTAGCRLDVVNRPDPATGLYLTVAIPFCAETLTAARLLWAQPLPPAAAIAKIPVERFATELLHWADAVSQRQPVAARLALATLAVRLCCQGCSNLLTPPPPRLSAQVRDLVAERPERDWRSRDFEHAFGMSGATLRRRLAAEGATLRDVIRAARLARALDFLYTTRWPVKTVAAKVGYRSAPSFARTFAARYGLEPTQIGNAQGAEST